MLCTSPCFASSELATYDSVLKAIISSVTNIQFGEQDQTCTLASLPVWSRVAWVLGMQCSLHLLLSWPLQLPPQNLVHQILPDWLHGTPDTTRDEPLAVWRHGLNITPPSDLPPINKKLGSPQILETYKSLLEKAPDAQSLARLLAAPNRSLKCGWISSQFLPWSTDWRWHHPGGCGLWLGTSPLPAPPLQSLWSWCE